MTNPFYYDCDTGIDDALSLTYLVTSPSVDLLGVGSVSGNVDSAIAARNCLDLLALLGRSDIPVAVGAHNPLVGTFDGGAPQVHGDNGIGNIALPAAGTVPVDESAAQMLVRLAREHPGRLRVLATAPLTNLALALRMEPRLPELVAEVTLMGGAALVPGNVTAVAEANIINDAEAAAAVFGADWPITVVPLDVTMDQVMTEQHRRQLAAIDHPAAERLAAMLEYYFGYYTPILGRPSAAMHDPLAAAVAVGAVRVGRAPSIHVTVDAGSGPGRGQTICDLRGRFVGFPPQDGAHCRVVLDLAEDFPTHLIATLRRLAPTPQPAPALTVVGSINIDITALGERLPSPGETVGDAVLRREPGGKGANQAAAAARLAGRSRLIGAVGSDTDGQTILARLAEAGVDISRVARVDGTTGTALVVVDRDGENQIAVCPGANAKVDLSGVEFADDEIVLCQLEIDLQVVEKAAARTRGYFALNAAPARRLPQTLVGRCDLIIVNESEYALLPELAEAKLVAVTYGAKGSALYAKGQRVAEAPGQAVPVVNTVGAGDAFCAALVLALCSGHDQNTALAVANAVGAHAVADASAQPVLQPLRHYHQGE